MTSGQGKIRKREDVNPEEGKRKYGDVAFADPVNKKYPLDTEAHVRAAHSYISQPDNAAKYSAVEVKTIQERINQAAEKYGIEIQND